MPIIGKVAWRYGAEVTRRGATGLRWRGVVLRGWGGAAWCYGAEVARRGATGPRWRKARSDHVSNSRALAMRAAKRENWKITKFQSRL